MTLIVMTVDQSYGPQRMRSIHAIGRRPLQGGGPLQSETSRYRCVGRDLHNVRWAVFGLDSSDELLSLSPGPGALYHSSVNPRRRWSQYK